MSDGWIGVDLDGTLAEYHGFVSATHIGPPIPSMLNRVKAWLRDGTEVRIVTARAAVSGNPWPGEVAPAIVAIEEWCERHVGQRLVVTATKDYAMIELWDDRIVRVEQNTGRVLGGPGGR